jgi:serine/threonine-protein kinase
MTSAVLQRELEPTFILPEGVLSLLAERDKAAAHDAAAPVTPRASGGVRLVDDDMAAEQDVPGALLRSRLQAAAWVILCGMALLFARQVGIAAAPVFPGVTGALLIIAVGALVLLCGPRALSERQLRSIELSLFGLAGAQLIAYETVWLVQGARAHDAVFVVATLNFAVLSFAILMLCYGMFMPNGWRRTAVMLTPPAFAPIAAAHFVRYFESFAASALPLSRLAESACVLVACVGIAIFGTQTIASLRHEARRGRRLGQYRLKRVLDQGGMGEVYLAEHQLLKRPCAIKTIRPRHFADPQSFIRFEREVCSMARLSHWHNVEIYDYGRTDDGTFYYVMEYLPGLNLAELVQRSGPLPPARVIHFLEQTCLALAEAHQQGLVHQDLKPANIFAAHRGGECDVTKLLDFGLVIDDGMADRLSLETTDASPFAGSPLYASPEQARGGRVDARSDVYSLGAVGYFLLTGQPPFQRPSVLRLILAHARDPVPPPSSRRSGVPIDLERVLLKCLEKDPKRRYVSADALRAALLRCADAGKWTRTDAAEWWRTHNSPEAQG